MRGFLFVVSLIFAIFVQTDEVWATNYQSSRIKRYVNRTPRDKEQSLSSLVSYITKPLDDDYDKAKAIAFWIAGHINYDEYLYNNGQTTKLIKSYRGQDARELLKSRVGICGDFAELFVEMCKRAGIRAEEVHGYAYPGTKLISENKLRRSASGHAWNYFKYKGKKIYVDTTFMAKGSTGVSGRVSNYSHKKALREVQRDNRYTSQVNDFDEYYFDFDYKDEMRKKRYIHQER
jgi:hypothetical protein